MSDARAEILGHICRALGRGALSEAASAALDARLAAHRRNLVPMRAASLDPPGRLDLFAAMAAEADSTVARLASPAEVPQEVARYLAAENLPAELAMAPDPALDAIPWNERPLLRIRRGRAEGGDSVGLAPCLAAIAETGTVMLVSGARTPTTLNFLPDTHIVVVRGRQVVASYEDGWDLARAGGALPRAINFITGPSRTADIEQRVQLGAHGPRRLHIIIIEDDGALPNEQTAAAG
jgi:L-lactate dehydrogenase complex protein LldG